MENGVMVIASHPDDAEIGMGGTIKAFSEKGIPLVVLDLTDGEPTPHGSPEIRKKETAEASKILGITERVTLDIKNREIFDTVENRKKVASVIRKYKPQVIFAPFWNDAHPDHVQASALVDSSRFYAKLVKTDLPHSPHYPRRTFYYFGTHIRLKVEPAVIFDISNQIESKMNSIAAYHSQFGVNEKNKHVMAAIKTEASYLGLQTGTDYGEPFACRENVRLQSVESLLNA